MRKFQTPLKYKLDSLEGVSEESMDFHYNKHYVGYCKNLEKLIPNTQYADMLLDEIIDKSAPQDKTSNTANPIYNNAAQIKNHEFFFEQLSDAPSPLEDGELMNMIINDYGSFDKMVEMIKSKLTGFFGVGWIWLTLEQHQQWDSPSIRIVATRDGNTFINHQSDEHFVGPICTIDVWEHSYYIDHRNDRSAYFDDIIKSIDWKVVEKRFNTHNSSIFDYTKPFEL